LDTQRTAPPALFAAYQEAIDALESFQVTRQKARYDAAGAKFPTSSRRRAASRGGEAMQRVVETMSEISHSSTRISGIVGVIESIAFQTN
ncbi:methyl-accepting chemotaxis protein, partial [Burkholderia cenocepacia]|nr:methyl-accepting chemotaxis protein [Burkholderia cenocepacia]